MTTKEMFQVSKFQVVNPLPFSFNKLFRCDDKTAKVKKTKTLIVEGEGGLPDFFFLLHLFVNIQLFFKE